MELNRNYRAMRVVLFVAFIVQATLASAQHIKPCNLFSDHMVLQQGQVVPVWGEAEPNEKITISFAGQRKSTYADKAGEWLVHLDALKTSKVGRDLVISGKQEIVLSDVLVGEVWICSGQSNMQFSVDRSPEVEGLIPFAENIRSFEVTKTVALSEQNELEGKWSTSHPNSAVAFSFAYFLNNIGKDVPVGIILSAWGSSSIEAWIPRDMTNTLPHFKKIMDEFDADSDTKNRIENILIMKEGWALRDDIFLRRQPNILYNAMMKPLAPYACAGLVWYQGERNTRYRSGMPEVTKENWFHRVAGMKEYGGIMKKWIQRYREEWGNDEMNFMIVMLPGFGQGTVQSGTIDAEDPTAESWAWMRESQLQVLDLPYTAVVNTIDLGDEHDIHPNDKLPIGQRLALLAGKNTLNQDVLASGPLFDRVEILNNSIRVYFKYADGLKTKDGKSPSAFWLSDASGEWTRAKAIIEGNSVLLSSTEVENPLYVRYGFSGKPKVNLVNRNNLPAYPFRTDNYEK